MTEFFIGTMGFSYTDWKGVFYPSGVPAREYLASYARIFDTVEMDTTFYAIPRPAIVQNWAASVPEHFQFTVKTPQTITHEMGLVQAKQFMDEFLDIVRLLGEKLGVVLVQLPPQYASDHLPILTTFLSELPDDIKFAIEFRHPSWFTEQTAELLTVHKICWAATEYSHIPHQIIPTVDFLYIRWLGKRAAFRHYEHEQQDRGPRLTWWREQILQYLTRVQQVFGYFNNDYAGFAPATCNRFKSLMELPVTDFSQPVQGRLF
jgi:uncharacterized protein YecE (DUF72 family)